MAFTSAFHSEGSIFGPEKSRKIRHANTGLPSKTVSAADVREEALNTAANGDADKLGQGDGDEHGAADADLDESFEEEPEVREVAISDICKKQWSKSVTLMIGVTFTMDVQLKTAQFMEKAKKNLELFHQDPDRVVRWHGDPQPNLCHAFNFSSVKPSKFAN